jgi:hypothetical protein
MDEGATSAPNLKDAPMNQTNQKASKTETPCACAQTKAKQGCACGPTCQCAAPCTCANACACTPK